MTVKTRLSIIAITFGSLLIPSPIRAAIRNTAIGEALGGGEINADAAKSGATFATYFVLLWRALISIGGIMVLIYFIWGALEWITGGSDPSKVDKARQRILNATLGLIILVSSFTILGFLSNLLFGEEFNLLQLTFPTPEDLAP